MKRRVLLVLAAAAGLWAVGRGLGYFGGAGLLAEDLPPRTANLFRRAPNAVQAVAAQIERGETPSPEDLAGIEDLDARYGDDITLFWHALAAGNLPALDALVKAGASMYQRAKTDHGFHFYEIMAQPGGDLIGPDGMVELVRIYLKNGGDPNASWTYEGSSEVELLPVVFAVYGNYAGLKLLLRAGADPFRHKLSNGKPAGSLVTTLATSTEAAADKLLDEMIDMGVFDDRDTDEIREVIRALSFYAPRGDEISLRKKALGMRILKRHPDYTEDPDARAGAGRLFKSHYDDPEPAEIPWDVILSDRVR